MHFVKQNNRPFKALLGSDGRESFNQFLFDLIHFTAIMYPFQDKQT